MTGLPTGRVGRLEMLRRLALGLLFGLLSARLRFRADEVVEIAGSPIPAS